MKWHHLSIKWRMLAALSVGIGAVPGRLGAQDSAARTSKNDESAIRLQEMTDIAHGFEFITVDGAIRTPAALASDPLHSWTDPTRPFSGGALWAVRCRSRPVAVLGIELYAAWSLEFVSLSTGLVEAHDGQLRWHPRKAGVEFHQIQGTPTPADDKPRRLRQMRDIVKRISASEFYENQTYSLRLLSHPIDRYADPAAGVVDGAIFVYANGTNPEILLLVEARCQREGKPTWLFAAAPMTRAQPTLKLDGKEIWSSPTKEQTSPKDTYFDTLRGRGARFRETTPSQIEE